MRQLDHTLLLTSSNFGVWADGFWSNRKGLNNVVLHCRCRTGPTGSSRSLLKLSIWVANYEIHSESDNKADNSRNWWHTLIFWVIFWPRFFDRMVWPIIAIANGLPIVWPANNPRMLKLVPNILPLLWFAIFVFQQPNKCSVKFAEQGISTEDCSTDNRRAECRGWWGWSIVDESRMMQFW